MRNDSPNGCIDIKSAHGIAADFLLDKVGNQIHAGRPMIINTSSDSFPVESVWTVPVRLSYPYTGPLGIVGVIAIALNNGEVVAHTPIKDIKSNAHEVRKMTKSEPRPNARMYMSMYE
ncbi:MAG: hypothetical protein AAF639_02785 [Chloroflexota bacterium]